MTSDFTIQVERQHCYGKEWSILGPPAQLSPWIHGQHTIGHLEQTYSHAQSRIVSLERHGNRHIGFMDVRTRYACLQGHFLLPNANAIIPRPPFSPCPQGHRPSDRAFNTYSRWRQVWRVGIMDASKDVGKILSWEPRGRYCLGANVGKGPHTQGQGLFLRWASPTG